MSWDDDDFEVKLPPGVTAAPSLPKKENWEDEEDATLTEAAAPAPAAAAAGPAAPEAMKEKHRRKEVERAKEMREAAEREEARKRLGEQGTPLADPAAERKRLEKLQLDADLEAARDSLGLPASSTAPGKDTKSLVAAVPLVDTDSFKLFGTEVAARVTAATGRSSAPALNFYRELLRDGSDKLSIDDINALMTLLNVQLTKKRAAAKPAAGKTKSAKGRMYVERDDDYSYAAGGGGGYADYGDLDAPGATAGAGKGKAAPAAEAPAAAAASAAPAYSAAALDGDFM